MLNFNNDNNNNIYLYHANSTLQFSNVPYNKRTVYYKYIKYNKIWSKIAKKIILQVFKILQYTCMVKVTGKKNVKSVNCNRISEKAFLKRWIFKLRLKTLKVHPRSNGRSFHSLGVAATKARLPRVRVLKSGF